MIASNHKDSDGFRLQFDENCSESDKKAFMEAYPKVDKIKDDRVHCTTCDGHIGTAPISEKIIRTHQILGVTQCNKCFAFYNSGEFGKGEDGSEYYCRWCGQGGEVFCCSTCPFVFCNKCIRSNLSSGYVKEIEETDDWSCFVCDKNILKKQRAQHWALRNFMNKQLEKIQKIHVNSEEELNNLLNEDVSICCPRKKRKSLVKPVQAPVKRPSMNGGGVQPPAKRANFSVTQPPKPVRVPVIGSYRPVVPTPKPGTSGRRNNDEIVCTPDIMGLFNENDDNAIPNSNMMPSTAPPPLVLRNNVRGPRPSAPTPIYHNVSGFQIDLNHAARQEIFRLPNGKLIQVRKQTGPPAPPAFRPGAPVANPRGPQFTIRQAGPVSAVQNRPAFRPSLPTARPRAAATPQARYTFSDGRVVATPTHQPTPTSTPQAIASTVFTQQNGSISVARAPQPNTPFGTAKTEFEDKIISGMEICQHTINKMITLTNSTSFKTSRTFKDLKDLYIHLQYLFTYTSGKFKTLQESLTTGMESLAQHEPAPKEKGDDDELEIVEAETDVIEVLSDDDEAAATEKTPAPVKKPLLKHIQYTKDTEKVEKQTENGEKEGSMPPTAEAGTAKTDEEVALDEDEVTPEEAAKNAELIEKDKKLRNHVMVKIEKMEESEDTVVQHYINQIKQRELAPQSPASHESTPEPFMLEPIVTLDEGAKDKPSSEDGDVVAIVIPDEEAEKPPEAAPAKSSVVDDDDDDVILIPEDDSDTEKPVDAGSKTLESSSDASKADEGDTEAKKTDETDSETQKSGENDSKTQKSRENYSEQEKVTETEKTDAAEPAENTIEHEPLEKTNEADPADKLDESSKAEDQPPVDSMEVDGEASATSDTALENVNVPGEAGESPEAEKPSEIMEDDLNSLLGGDISWGADPVQLPEPEKSPDADLLTNDITALPISENSDVLNDQSITNLKQNGDIEGITAITENEKALFDELLLDELEEKTPMEVD